MTAIILDIDNCIADDEWRIPKINWNADNTFHRYHDYHLLSAFDKVGNKHLFEGVSSKIVVLTARPFLYFSMTSEWLLRNGVNYHLLMMRNNEDMMHSRDLKRRQVLELNRRYGITPADIEVAYDDREDVVAMYKAFGINAQVCSIHNTCAYTQPTKESK